MFAKREREERVPTHCFSGLLLLLSLALAAAAVVYRPMRRRSACLSMLLLSFMGWGGV